MIKQYGRRALAAALCAAALVTSVLGAYTDQGKITQTEAVDVLTELGVMEGKADGAFDPTGTLTRAEAAKILVEVLNGAAGGDYRTTVQEDWAIFSDTAGHWARPWIESATDLGLVSGRGNGLFDPDGTVTGSELAKMTLVALGYQAKAERMLGAEWQSNTDALATQTGLFDGIEIDDTAAPINREDAARLVANAMVAPMVFYVWVIWSDNGNTMTGSTREARERDYTLLNAKFSKTLEDGKLISVEQ